jgi:DNA helicase-2/ATP-dependent DNA helicase PcrA
MKLKPEDWLPVGVQSLETAASEAVKENSNLLVVAGPGAGKTELLAQKACYLLQTRTCIYPQRILAISLKRDSAANLKERVFKRCAEDSYRFDSLTFDAFVKTILDRFRDSLPLAFRLSKNYEIGLSIDEIGVFLTCLDYNTRPEHQPLLNILRSNGRSRTNLISNFDKTFLTSFQLNDPNRNHEYILNWAADCLWNLALNGGNDRSKITYQMATRLSQLIINTNPYIKKSIQATYSHVFLDEFQDTTSIQYDFLKTCFFGSSSCLTAVGDSKQTVMLWAGALEDVFERFQQDFNARKKILLMNFRCATQLVELQTIIAKYLDDTETGQTPHHTNTGIIKRIDFRDDGQEALELASKVRMLINEEGIAPDQICFLFKQRVPANSSMMILRMQALGINARVEDLYQELLKEEFVQLLISFISYVFDLNVNARDEVFNILVSENQLTSEVRRIEKRMSEFKAAWRLEQGHLSLSEESLTKFIDEIVTFTGRARIFSLVQHYNSEIIANMKYNFVNKFYEILSRTKNIKNSIDEFLGKGVVKCMSIHKSKGLEFEVVFLIGLEDDMYWNFTNQTREDVNTFFVAVSRPISQLYMTFCYRRNNTNQTRTNVLILYNFLTLANVTYFNRAG